MYTDIADDILDDMLNKIYSSGKKIYENKKTTINVITKFSEDFLSSYTNPLLDKYNDKDLQFNIKQIYGNYIAYYILLYIGVSMSEKEYNKFILSMGRDSIFTSKVLDTDYILKQIIFISKNKDKIRDKVILLDQTYTKSLNIYNNLSDLFTSNLEAKDVFHSIVKYVLFMTLFVVDDKVIVYNYLEEYKLRNLKSKLIEIIETTEDQINYGTLEKLLENDSQVFVDDMYNLMLEGDDIEVVVSLEEKIKLLFKRRLVIPITDDFLRYNKSSEIYDQSTNIDANIRSNKKNNTKIKYIINKINEVMDFYKNKNPKHFYSPLYYRKAVLVNDMEELDILKKLDNTQNKTDEQISHYEELTIMRKYPYQNFRDFKDYGYDIEVDDVTEAIRYSNIEFINDPKYDFVRNHVIDWRVLPTKVHNNIVGLAVPHDVTDVSYLESIVNKLVPFNNKGSDINGLIKQIKSQILTDSHNKHINYWMFNKKKDQIQKFNEIYNFPQNEYYKFVTAYVYDVIAEVTFEKIINVLSSSEITDYNMALETANTIEKQLVPLTDKKRREVYEFIFMKMLPHYKKEYDHMEDHIPGKKKKLIPLSIAPEFPDTGVKRVLKITKDICMNLVDIYENAQCQHLVTWNKIITLRRNHPNKFNDKLHTFFKEFVIENLDREFICKSCSEIIAVKKYLADWTSNTDEGVAMTLLLHTSLENLTEYEKYGVAIKNMEKFLEKLSSSVGLLYFTGAKPTAKQKRQESIKIVIDLITAQHEKMKKMDVNDRKKRAATSAAKYGVISNLSHYFLFELKNDIFTYSSKEVDKFKKGKINNIMTYILLIMLIEMSSSIIHGFTTEKMLNYYVFEKIGYSLFDGLYIRINSGNDISPIKHYKLLCYCIFMISGFIVKYNMWFSDETKKSTISAMDQKIIIHTTIDLLNNILDFNNPESTNYIYEYYSRKFFSVLQTAFTGESATADVEQLKSSVEKRIQVVSSNKIIFKTAKERESVIKNYYDKVEFGEYQWAKYTPSMIMEKFKVALTYKDVFSDSEYKKLKDNVKINTEKTKNNMKREKKIVNVEYEYDMENVNNDLYEHIEKTISEWEKIIGVDARIGNMNLYLRNNVYTINHDKDGNKIENVKRYTDNDNVVIFKKNDPHFNTNVYYYFDKEKDIHMYYNSQTYNYMGYRTGKNYHNVTDTNANLRPIISVKNKLLFLGYSNLYNTVTKDLEESLEIKTANISNKLRKFVSNITRTRINNLKNTIINFQRIINQIITNNKKLQTESIAKTFDKKFKSLTLNDNGNRVFGDINEVLQSSYFKPFEKNINITVDKEYLYVGNLIKIYNTDHKLLMYICNKMNEMLQINNDEHAKITMIYLFSHIIHQEYNNHNFREFSNSFSDVKRFVNMESNHYVKIEIEETDIFAGMSEEEENDAREEMYDEQEMNDAIDVDLEDDDEDGGNSQVASSFGGDLD